MITRTVASPMALTIAAAAIIDLEPRAPVNHWGLNMINAFAMNSVRSQVVRPKLESTLTSAFNATERDHHEFIRLLEKHAHLPVNDPEALLLHDRLLDAANAVREWEKMLYYQYDNLRIVCEHTTLFKVNAGQGFPHCEDGPCMEWQDGFRAWGWNGVVVDEELIMRPEEQNLLVIRAERNAELRRVRIERYGWGRYLQAMKAGLIDSRHNAVECTKEALMRIGTVEQVLICHCPSTGRVYAMSVPDIISTCEDAQNYLWGGSRLAEASSRPFNIIGRS